MMSIRRDVLSVFLASPSDLASEREIVKEVVSSFNTKFAKHTGYTIELLAWEDIPPGAGRPQARINPGVDQCALFVGLLWKRWGTPTRAGKTGFEEEFERATERRRNADLPRSGSISRT